MREFRQSRSSRRSRSYMPDLLASAFALEYRRGIRILLKVLRRQPRMRVPPRQLSGKSRQLTDAGTGTVTGAGRPGLVRPPGRGVAAPGSSSRRHEAAASLRAAHQAETPAAI